MNPPSEKTIATHLKPLRAILRREWRSALLNRTLQVFSVFALGGGLGAVLLAEDANSAVYLIFQMVLYVTPLFALLAGVASAHAEAEEWALLLTQPMPRWAPLFGKFIALSALFLVQIALLLTPALFIGASATTLAIIGWQSLLLTAVFGALGLCAGFLSSDRVRSLLAGVGAWLILLFGVDGIALFAALWPTLQRAPSAWLATLMLNPLDAFRIHMLFALEQVPLESVNKIPLAAWWLSHSGLWLSSLALGWIAALLGIASRRLARLEV